MNAKVVLNILMTMLALQVSAHKFNTQEDLKLEVPELKLDLATPELTLATASPLRLEVPEAAPKMDFSFFKSRTNPSTKPYKFWDDITFAGVPLFAAGLIAKSEKAAFKQQSKHSLVPEFKSRIDDYSQFFGPAMVVGLKLGGVEGRSDWPRLMACAAMSYGLMAGLVNGIKYTAKEMRPDGSQANSWPSGHTATAFVGATLLHKEFGLTRSPWYSVAGYGVATATGVMRVLNNRHWISDILSGAGIGIMSTEIAYALSDVLFKGKGLLRNDIPGMANVIEHPSFFSINMGIGFGTRNLDFEMENFGWADNMNLQFQASTAVGAEGAYYFNPYIGVGGRLRVKSSPIKGWNAIEDFAWGDVYSFFESLDEDEVEAVEQSISNVNFVIDSDHLTEFAADLGAYFNFPLSERFALGSKLLIGRSIMQELNLDAILAGKSYRPDDGNTPTGPEFEKRWDYFVVSGSNSFKYGTGLSLTYAYKQNFSWKVFVDYDFTRKDYTMKYDMGGLYTGLFPELSDALTAAEYKDYFTTEKTITKNMHSFVLGASFAINF